MRTPSSCRENASLGLGAMSGVEDPRGVAYVGDLILSQFGGPGLPCDSDETA